MAMVMVSCPQCERCGHVWMPRTGQSLPKNCPSCNSPYWDRPRRIVKAKELDLKGGVLLSE